MLRTTADQFLADGEASVDAVRTILSSEGERLGTEYSPAQPFRAAVATYLERSVGLGRDLDPSTHTPTSVKILWSQIVQRLRDKVQAALLHHRYSEEDEARRHMFTLAGIGLVATGSYILATLALCLRRAHKRRSNSRTNRWDLLSNRLTTAEEALAAATSLVTTVAGRLRDVPQPITYGQHVASGVRRFQEVPPEVMRQVVRARQRDEDRPEAIPLMHR
jgi:hypothetical protein